MKSRLIVLVSTASLAACGQSGTAPAPETEQTAPPPAASATASPSAPAVAAMDKAKLANPCLLDPKAVGAALGFAVEKTEPETMGDMSGCTYRGAEASLRLNFIWHDPVYFEQATTMTRNSRPGDKRDVPGDPDKAWLQQGAVSAPILHYYRQNVEVELVALSVNGDAKMVEAALLKLPRVP